jgi:succinate dehydrogenase flavoprotein subunit
MTATLTERGRVRRVIVVGDGLAGMLAALELCEARVPVLMLSVAPARRSLFASARGGFAAADPARTEDDSPNAHFEETIVAGDFLAHQPPVRALVEAAPELVELADRLGVAFARTREGARALCASSGSFHRRAAFAGATTGRQLATALDDQLRRFETHELSDERGIGVPGEKMLERRELWDFLGLVRDDGGVAVGVVAQDLRTMRVKAFPADAVCLATEGPGALFGGTTQGLLSGAGATAAAYRAGAAYANGEFLQFCPTAIAGAEKPFLVPPGALGAGGRLWVPRDKTDPRRPADIPEKERDYFLECDCPSRGNLAFEDVAARAIVRLCAEGRGAFDAARDENARAVYLDVTHLDPRAVQRALAGSQPIVQRFAGSDPLREPLRVFPAVAHALGGLWVDYEADDEGRLVVGSPRNHATSITGLYAAGDASCQYHGANALGDNALPAALFSGRLAARAMAAHRAALAKSAFDLPASVFDNAEAAEAERFEALLERGHNRADAENPFALHAELGRALVADGSVERDDDRLDRLLDTIGQVEERMDRARVPDTSLAMNQSAQFARHFEDLLLVARVIVEGARRRDECRGAHYKPALDPKRATGGVGRDDARWLRATLAVHEERGRVSFVRELDYECAGRRVHAGDAVDTRFIAPRPRDAEPGMSDGQS